MAYKHWLLTGIMYQSELKKPEKNCNCSKINKKGLLLRAALSFKYV